MKPTLLVFALGVASISPLIAADESISAVLPESPSAAAPGKKGEGGGRMQGMLEQRLKQLDEALKLTPEQKGKIKDIWAKEAGEMKKGSPAEKKGKGREAVKAIRDQIRAVLTPEQQTKFDRMRPEGPAGADRAKGKKP